MPYSNESAWLNDWPISDDKKKIGVVKFAPKGIDFPGGVKGGDVHYLLTDLCEHLHLIEAMHAGWCWGWAPRPNKNNTRRPSRHAAGIAIDYNAPSHPNGKAGTWSKTKKDKINALLKGRYRNLIRWGENYNSTIDGMHFEVNGTPAEIAGLVRALKAAKSSGPKKTYAAKAGDTVESVVKKFKPTYPSLTEEMFRALQTPKLTVKIHDLVPDHIYRVEP